jgi:hypothetical protein
MPRMGTKALRNVELAVTGTWAASTGPTTIDRVHLESMLAAATDPEVDAGPLKIGHVDRRFAQGEGDGEPAFGWAIPKSVVPKGDGRFALRGDIVGIPAKLAAAIPTAWRRRSPEIAFGYQTPSGKKYAAAFAGLALLGIAKPAIKGLADVLALYSDDAGAALADGAVRVHYADGVDDTAVVAMLAAAEGAGVTAEQLETLRTAAGVRDTGNVPAPVDEPAEDSQQQQTTTGGTTVAGRTDEEIRTLLGLEADADVNAELERIKAERAKGTGADDQGDKGTSTDGNPAGDAGTTAPAGTGTTAPATTDDGTVKLSQGTYDELVSMAADVRKTKRENALATAFRQGRITADERKHFASQLEKGGDVEAATYVTLTQLAPRFSVTETGGAGNEAHFSAGPDADAFDAWEKSVFGE